MKNRLVLVVVDQLGWRNLGGNLIERGQHLALHLRDGRTTGNVDPHTAADEGDGFHQVTIGGRTYAERMDGTSDIDRFLGLADRISFVLVGGRIIGLSIAVIVS